MAPEEVNHMANSRSESLHRMALEALEAGLMEEAVARLRQAVSEDAENSQAWNDLGVVMEALGNPTPAVECYRRALEISPMHREARSNLLTLELQAITRQRMREEAAQIFRSRMAPAGVGFRSARAMRA
jgi:Flp pilus assembly protein TadD